MPPNPLLAKTLEGMPPPLLQLATFGLQAAASGYSGVQAVRKSYLWHDGLRDTIVDTWVIHFTPIADGDVEQVRPSCEVFDSLFHELFLLSPTLREESSGQFRIPSTKGIHDALVTIDVASLSVLLTVPITLDESVARETLSMIYATLPATSSNEPMPDG